MLNRILIKEMLERMGLTTDAVRLSGTDKFVTAVADIESFDGATCRLVMSVFATGVIDVDVSKEIDIQSPLAILEAVNDLNAEASGLTYYVTSHTVCVKSTMNTGWDADAAYRHLMATLSAAMAEFPNFG